MSFEIKNCDGEKLLSSLREVDLILTSPPYNIGSKAPRNDGHRANGAYDPKSYGGITGYADSLPENEYQKKQIAIVKLMATALKRDGVLVYNHKPRRKEGAMIHPMLWLSQVRDLTLMEEIIWDRGSTHNHSDRLMWPHTERLYVFRRTDGEYRLRNREGLAFRSDIWKVPLTARPADGHAAPFPQTLADNVVKTFSRAGDLVCDPYSGSGTTAIAAITQGRNFIGSELDKVYHKKSLLRVAASIQQSNVIQFKKAA